LTAAGQDAAADGAGLGPRQVAALQALREGPLAVAGLMEATGASHSTLRTLEGRGLVELAKAEERRRPEVRRVGAPSPAGRALTPAQNAALAEVLARLDAPEGSERRVLLHGVTGSGKTEVYLHAVAAVLERGLTAIVLVPEIGLTPQTASRFADRFGDTVAILHSGLSDGERYDEWLRLRRGQATVCVGPRSAVFAPLSDLGLIVIDEEHDPSYKQDGDPRYDARRVAELRAEASGAVLLAGSATPRPESWHRLDRISIPERVDGRPMPPVEILGMAPVESALHPTTRDALEQVRDQGGKAIVLLNRRGWSNFISCRGCARVWECPNCDVALVLHRAAGRVSCHHCGHSERVPERCPDCGSVSVARHGAGTERLEGELSQILDPLPVLRLDSDSGAGRGAGARILERFDALEAGVLVGTQMVAKGHDFPDVTLGVVIDADSTLRFPDFRAEERTFALVAQLAGRTGRGGSGGRVLVQALDAAAPCLAHASAHDAPGFLADELGRREALAYPPYADLVRVVCASPDGGPERRAIDSIVAAVRAGAPTGLTVSGPAALFRLKGRERAQALFRSRDRAEMVRQVRVAVEAAAADSGNRGVVFSVDVDPQ
jgi:primosomal protein N' (replication factor Y)